MSNPSLGTEMPGAVATRGTFTENTRVQIPAALHLYRLGYKYLSHIGEDDYDHNTNILKDVFLRSLIRLNDGISDTDAQKMLDKIVRICANDDIGREFYKELLGASYNRRSNR